MATRRAIANGNWSATGTWNGGVVPGNGDTVYASGWNITLDVDILIGGANNPTVSAGSFVAGQWYEVDFVGTTSWTGIGAASNTTGTVFLATGGGSGTGTAKALATLTTVANTPAGAAAGGSFVMSTVRAMTCDLRSGTTTCLNVTATTGTLTLSGIRVVGGAATNAFSLNNNATATLELAGGTYTGGTTTNANAVNNASTGVVNVSGACTFIGGTNSNTINNASTGAVNISASCTFTGGSNNGITVNNASTGAVNISASCTFTGGMGGSHAINNASTGTINVSAPCTFKGGFGQNSFGLNNASTGTVIIVQSTFTASAFANAVNIVFTSADVCLSGGFLDHWSGWKAVSGGKWRLGTTPTAASTRYALAGTTDSYVEMFTADNTGFGLPAANHVRSGISYGGGAVTGTCAVPAAGSVSLGVPVDNTTGTAVLTPEAVWSATNRTITGGSVDTATTLTNAPASVTPADIWSHASRTITGGTVDTLTNAPSVPSAASIRAEIDSNSTQLAAIKAKTDALPASPAATGDIPSVPSVVAIRQEMDSNSTKLANLDASVASRLASASYTAPATPPSAAEIATAVESSLLNEADGQAVLNAIVGAIGNSNVDEIALVAAIRSDLERTGGKLDSIPTTSAPSASAVASATRTELSTELSRIDQSISSRLASSSYTAPANSDISAIKAKTDNLPASPAATGDIPTSDITAIKTRLDSVNVERVNNTATTQIVGTLIAQSQS